MNRRFIQIGPQIRTSWRSTKHEGLVSSRESGFSGACVQSDVSDGQIKVIWDMETMSTLLQPHEARALGEALIAAADHVAAYKVQP
jgi:hypothetical protein